MDIKQLQYFIEVAKYNSFTRAADALFITQPTISKMIKNLEDELGVVLFDRSRKGLTLTDAGQTIFDQAKLVDKAFNNLEMELDNLLGLKKGHIRIGLPPIFDPRLFPKLIGSFHDRYPHITFELMEDGSKKIEEEVASLQLDIGVVVLPTNTDMFQYFAFMEEDLRLIIHPDHPLAVRDEINLAELREESFILFNKDFVLHDRIISSCNQAGFSPHITSESSQWSFIEEMVVCKLGVSLLPESICRHLTDEVRAIKVVNPSISWHLALIWNKDQYLSFAAKEWLSYAKEQLSEE
ncbi:LysR family transcriptional regulator [Fictibacillus sp. WQ 8-8]|uniref:cidABC operon transcriptional activator CidR n=1 Tax=unclassified Fictibacillus TaxID=2644029 RepID=UPI0008E628EB|nr:MULTISPECIES: LysR family transcriptional regulator [unclassified Fictibacillus]MCQ6267569.1 LysR family transcriptional regulator [Fictibacillus sp. WQ 8-8]MED2971058.1 LysR family transcriptional regulator [Fictibacillus sp. B-59209]UZJ78463.1 LysR family transcriptional regulator [Fictibacillus sp. KU28468]SFE48793.1 DNA-binding transcriptional regulator, LysR family [Bacillus sp. OV194]